MSNETGLDLGKLSYDVEVITPTMAREMIENLRDPHRKLDLETVDELKALMLRGEWEMKPDPIILDENNRVVEGYHRLKACIEANTDFKAIIVRGLNPDIRHTMDARGRVKLLVK